MDPRRHFVAEDKTIGNDFIQKRRAVERAWGKLREVLRDEEKEVIGQCGVVDTVAFEGEGGLGEAEAGGEFGLFAGSKTDGGEDEPGDPGGASSRLDVSEDAALGGFGVRKHLRELIGGAVQKFGHGQEVELLVEFAKAEGLPGFKESAAENLGSERQIKGRIG